MDSLGTSHLLPGLSHLARHVKPDVGIRVDGVVLGRLACPHPRFRALFGLKEKDKPARIFRLENSSTFAMTSNRFRSDDLGFISRSFRNVEYLIRNCQGRHQHAGMLRNEGRSTFDMMSPRSVDCKSPVSSVRVSMPSFASESSEARTCSSSCLSGDIAADPALERA